MLVIITHHKLCELQFAQEIKTEAGSEKVSCIFIYYISVYLLVFFSEDIM